MSQHLRHLSNSESTPRANDQLLQGAICHWLPILLALLLLLLPLLLLPLLPLLLPLLPLLVPP
jgi:hypothetical protein